ncbi:MAG: 2-aminoethylphosphonate--pyruvate transaminase, partial [Pseudomonadota bacterium]
ANKCIEGTPGFGFAIVKKDELLNAKGNCHSLSLDLYDQWQQMENNGQWRFTPPTHVIAAFIEALKLHKQEGGAAGRLARYTRNRDTLVAGMQTLGFETLLDGPLLSPIIVTFLNPADKNFRFERFYELMKQRGFIIYPGKLTEVDSFRIGCIGQLNSDTMQKVAAAASESLAEMSVNSARPAHQHREVTTV